jgi:hypothetical protein
MSRFTRDPHPFCGVNRDACVRFHATEAVPVGLEVAE